MLRKFWSIITAVPHAEKDYERIKYVVMRTIVFWFGITVLAITVLFAVVGDRQSHTDVTLLAIWAGQVVVFIGVWILLATKYYRIAVLPWAVVYILNAYILIPKIGTEGTVYRVEIYLLLGLLVFSVYMRKAYLYVLATAYFAVLVLGIFKAGLHTSSIVLPFTLAFTFGVAAIELVTRIRAAEARMIELERVRAIHSSRLSTLGETTAFLMHEVSSPLTILNGHLELIKKNEDPEFHIRRMENALARAIDFISSVKRMVQASDPDQFETVQISEILKMVSDLVEPGLRRKHIALEFEYPEDLLFKCRPAEIAQVLINLINNSADALGDAHDRWIRVSVSLTGTMLDFDVADPGTGVDPTMAKKIMEPFFTTKKTGSGIGLTIAQQVARLHDGQLLISSLKNPTTFKMRIAVEPKFTRRTKPALLISNADLQDNLNA